MLITIDERWCFDRLFKDRKSLSISVLSDPFIQFLYTFADFSMSTAKFIDKTHTIETNAYVWVYFELTRLSLFGEKSIAIRTRLICCCILTFIFSIRRCLLERNKWNICIYCVCEARIRRSSRTSLRLCECYDDDAVNLLRWSPLHLFVLIDLHDCNWMFHLKPYTYSNETSGLWPFCKRKS